MAKNPDNDNEDKENKALLKLALDRFELAEEAESKFRSNAKEDLDFVNGDQWNVQARNNRESAGLPCYTVNKVAEYLRHITNELRQNKPSIQVDPTSGGAVKEVADIYAGLIRHIEIDSSASTAYDTAAWYAVATGRGYIRVVSEYEDYTTNNQKLVIKTIENPESVYYDPNSKMPDGSDAEWCFIINDMPVAQYRRKYKDSKLTKEFDDRESLFGISGAADWVSNTQRPDWMNEQTIRVAEYYYKDYETKTLYTVQIAPSFEQPDGNTITTYSKPSDEDLTSGKALIISKRKVDVPTVKWTTLNAVEVLEEETVWPSDYIPVLPVVGNEVWVNGKRHCYGAVRNAKDSQRSYNWLVSIQTQMIASAPLAPFVGFKGQFKDVEAQWRDVNVSPIAYLEVDSVDSNGQQQSLPQRMNQEPPIQAVAATRAAASDDIKAIFGTFDASLGAQSNEVSGKAILARTNQSNLSNYHYYDNETRTITQLGRILVQVIPAFYDNERIIRIVGENGERKMVQINTIDPKTGKPKNDLSVGKYDVVIETGPSYATRRQEAATEMQTLIQAYPQAGPLIADLAADAMDWPGSSLVAKRLRAAVPPEVLQATGEDGTDDMEPAAKAQMLQQQLVNAQKNLQALNAHAAQVEQELKNQTEENKLLKLKADIELAKAEMDGRLKSREMDIEEETTVLEFRVKEKELELQERAMALQEAQVGIKAVAVADQMNHSHMDRVEAAMERDALKGGGVGNMPTDMKSDVGVAVKGPDMDNLTSDMSGDMSHSMGDSLGGKFSQ